MYEFHSTQPTANPMKKWMSEPNLLGDYQDDWIKDWDNAEENGVSFTQEVAQPRLVNINKARVQLRPKRRPPSRDFVKSMASLHFDISVPEDIEEEEEEEEEEDEDEEEDLGKTNGQVKSPVKSPVKPPVKPPRPSPKPSEHNAWRLPSVNSEIVLRKTPSAESKTNNEGPKQEDVPEVTEKPVATSEEEKQQKGRRRFKVHLFKFRRSRRGKENGNKTGSGHEDNSKDTNSNLANLRYLSVDSGSRPLGEETPKRWPHHHRRPSEEGRRLNWLMRLFHKRNATRGNSGGEGDEDASPPHEASSDHGNHGDTNVDTTRDVDKEKSETNGTTVQGKTENDLTNGHTTHQDEADEKAETVSDLKKKFERISAAF